MFPSSRTEKKNNKQLNSNNQIHLSHQVAVVVPCWAMRRPLPRIVVRWNMMTTSPMNLGGKMVAPVGVEENVVKMVVL